jgi:hypothetical protein
MYFRPADISLVKDVFSHAETLSVRHFGLGADGMKDDRYEVTTLAHLENHEVNEGSFAHLCRYFYQKEGAPDHPDNFYFFKICLQDNRILDAVERGRSFIKLPSLLLYIALHELVHVVRFNRGEIDFDAPLEEKMEEEEKVHLITRNILKPVADRDLGLVLDCFSERYHVGDIFSVPQRIMN